MNEIISVDQALKRGHKMVTYPGLAIMVGMFGLAIYLGSLNIFPGWFWAIAIVVSIGSAWFYWSFMITKWRLWAFENVRNVHELKKRATIEKIIWADDNFFEKTEIRSAAEKQKWIILLEKFKQQDVFMEDYTIPNETIIYFSKGKNLAEMAIMLFCLGFGLYTIIEAESYFLGSVFCIVGSFFGFKSLRQATNKAPQIILNEQGIQTASTPFFEWDAVENEEVTRKNTGKNTHHYLKYAHPRGLENLEIDDLDTNYKELTKLLILYRGRYQNRNRHW